MDVRPYLCGTPQPTGAGTGSHRSVHLAPKPRRRDGRGTLGSEPTPSCSCNPHPGAEVAVHVGGATRPFRRVRVAADRSRPGTQGRPSTPTARRAHVARAGRGGTGLGATRPSTRVPNRDRRGVVVARKASRPPPSRGRVSGRVRVDPSEAQPDRQPGREGRVREAGARGGPHEPCRSLRRESDELSQRDSRRRPFRRRRRRRRRHRRTPCRAVGGAKRATSPAGRTDGSQEGTVQSPAGRGGWVRAKRSFALPAERPRTAGRLA